MQAKIAVRSNGGQCPICFNQTSFAEQAIYFYISKIFRYVENRKRIQVNKGKLEADIYIPELNLIIEYDGYFFHKNNHEKDKRKVKLFRENGYEIINIREKGLEESNFLEIKVGKKESELEDAINSLVLLINKLFSKSESIEIKIDRDRIDILNNYLYQEKRNSLAANCPEIAKEWNYKRNGRLIPESFSKNSGQKVWWKCDKGHEWEAKIISRYRDGNKCLNCRMNKRLNLKTK